MSNCTCGSRVPDLHSAGCAAPLIEQLQSALAAEERSHQASRDIAAIYVDDLTQLRADLAAALSGGADAAAQRDTALGLCKERERELATMLKERELARAAGRAYYADLNAERTAHAETRKALDAKNVPIDLESTRAALARSEAREKTVSLLLDKCECSALSTQIQLWQLEAERG